MKKRLHINKGFSLVELIIVIAILAILAAAIAPAILRYIDKSKRADDIASADAIQTALKASMSEGDINDIVMAWDVDIKDHDASATTILLVCASGDDEWTNPTTNADLDELKEVLDKTCAPPVIKYKKKIVASSAGNSNSNYCLGTSGQFTPKGWAVGINPNDELCVYITNGALDTSVEGIALNPNACRDYK
ncbi:MAG: prepilin-type N-terminal cleavage/methylation domain-containing protein [Eubacterium sp.]|nr:prepilin-type N-terminal cleavage/methylation domain-containing protein [Eubacterium sp.]